LYRQGGALSCGTKELTSGQFQIAQLGATAFLPNTTGGRKTQYAAELSPASGGLKNIPTGQLADDIDWIRTRRHLSFGVSYMEIGSGSIGQRP
jgi:hypothetical protein